MVFGVRDAGTAVSPEERIVGIRNTAEFARLFRDQMSNIEPTLDFTPQNPPIEVPRTGKVILVVHVPPGNRGPHMTGERAFYKRTNGGNELMTYSAIETAFVRYEERIAKVKLLYLTLIDLWIRAEGTMSYQDESSQYSLVIPDPQTIMPILSDTYGLLSPLQDLPVLLIEIRQAADVLSTAMRLFHQQELLPMSGRRARTLAHNKETTERAKGLQKQLDRALDILEGEFGFSREKRETDAGRVMVHIEGIE